VVQLDVSVNDNAGHPLHGLQKDEFEVSDDGKPREIRIFAGEIDSSQLPAQPEITALPPLVYSNRFGLRDSPFVTAIVIDAVRRPDGLQKDAGNTPRNSEVSLGLVAGPVRSAIYRMEPGQIMAIYAAYPDLRVVQEYTSDPDRLLSSLNALVAQKIPQPDSKKEPRTLEALVPPMLSALREVAGRMSVATGRKSMIWVSQAYGSDLRPAAIKGATDSTIVALNDASVPLYAVDTRLNATCEDDPPFSTGAVVNLICSQPPDGSDQWMQYLANATGGKAFSGGPVDRIRQYDAQGHFVWGQTRFERDHDAVTEALRFAADDARYAYEMGFYVTDSELDGRVHALGVSLPAQPKAGLRYRSSYTASAEAISPTSPELTGSSSVNESHSGSPRPLGAGTNGIGIDAKLEPVANTNELRVSVAFDPASIVAAQDNTIVIDETFIETDFTGKQLAKVDTTSRLFPPGSQQDMIRDTHTFKLAKNATFLRILIHDETTNHTGTLTIPLATRLAAK
jgi:VWFA-related protein